MLKLGWMARATDAEVFAGHVKFARELDLDVIDFHLGGMPRDIDFVMKIKMMCVKAGLPVGYLGGGSFVGPLDMREARMEQGRADVDMTALMGGQMLRVFARHNWPDTKEEQEYFWGPMIEDFKELSDYAAERGVVIGLQNHDNGSFCMTADQALRILGDVDKENFTFLWDTGQWLGAIGSHPRGEFDPNVDLYEDYLGADRALRRFRARQDLPDRHRRGDVPRLPSHLRHSQGRRIQRQHLHRLRGRRGS